MSSGIVVTSKVRPNGDKQTAQALNGKRSKAVNTTQFGAGSSDEDKPLMKKARKSNGSAEVARKPSSSKDSVAARMNSDGVSKKRPVVKEEEDESSDSDAPLGKPEATKAAIRKMKKVKPVSSADDSSDSDAPLTLSQNNGKAKSSNGNVKQEDEDRADEEDDEEDDEDDEEEDGDEEDDDGASTSRKGRSQKIEHSGTGGDKWKTLYHTGPRFPPAYEPLPKSVKMKYDGKPVALPPDSEESAFFYAVKLETQHARDAVFNSNFFQDWKSVLAEHPPLDGTKIEKFEKCDFQPMYDHWRMIKDEEAAKKKMMAPSARKKQLEEKKKAEVEMKTCIVDGVEQKVGNVIVEPPALFLGRGEHPKKGKIKRRVPPEAITINHTLGDPKHPPPAPPAGHRWKEVKEDRSTTWLAFWVENINGQYKYMYLDATSKFKSNSDREKFEKARNLDRVVDRLRRNIDVMVSSKVRKERQLGTVVWLIDNFSLRAGNEKGDDEAATYGVCSLLVEHVKSLNENRNQVKLEFLGKDSMRFKETLNVPQQIFKNFRVFTQATRDEKGNIAVKKKTDEIFDKVDTSDVNKFLQNPANGGQKGLSAKVFRTYNASTTFQGLLNQTEENLKRKKLRATPQTLRDEYNQANRLVAILCNHQKTVNPVQSDKAAARFEERMLAIKYERFKERQKLLTYGNAKTLKEEFPAKSYDWAKQWSTILQEVDITAEQIQEHEDRMIQAKKDRIQAAFDRAELERQYQEEQAKQEAAVKAEAEDVKPLKQKKGKKSVEVKHEDDSEDDKKKVSKRPTTQTEVNAEKKALDDELKVLQKERKSGKSEQGKSVNVASAAKKVLAKITQMEKLVAEQATKEKTSDVSLGTSKLNYIDPRITVAWLKKWDAKLVEMEGAPVNKKAKLSKEESESPKKQKGAVVVKAGAVKKEEKTNKTADSDKMELDLKVIPISHYFPMTMLKKFKWAAQEEDGSDLSPHWVFVKAAESKIRDNMSSARRKGGAAGDSDGSDDEDEDDAVDSKDQAQARTAVAAAKVNTAKMDSKKSSKTGPSQKKAKAKDSDHESSSDDDAPLARK